MDRTVRMLRRTLLCAVFACPLAAWQLLPAQVFQALYSLLSALFGREQSALWLHRENRFSTLWGRTVFTLCLSLACSAGLYRMIRLVGEGPAPRALCMLTGLLVQSALFARVKRAGKRHLAACLPALSLFIACMR